MKNTITITLVILSFVCNLILANPIYLEDKSSTITYTHDQVLEAPVAFANSTEDILLVKDMEGHFYVPGKDYHNLPPLKTGSKYRIVISRPIELIWNTDPKEITLPSLYQGHLKPSHFEPVEPTDNNMSILVTGLPEEGEIGVKTSYGIYAGAAAFKNQDWIGITIWGDNPDTTEVDGACKEELFQLSLKDSYGNYQTCEYEILEGDEIFEPDGLAVFRLLDDDEIDSEYGLQHLYPNPFCGSTVVRFNLKDTCNIDLAIFDISGKRVLNLASGTSNAGGHQFSPNMVELASGVYIVRLRYGNYVTRQKLMLLK